MTSPDLAPPSPRWRFDRLSLVVLVVWLAYLGWVALGAVDDFWHAEWDGAIYLLTARSLALGDGYTYLGEPFFLRPPGFAWLLSHSYPGPDYDWADLNRWLHLGAGIAIGLWYQVLRRRFARPIALGIAVATGITPLFVHDFNAVLSEFPFLVALFAGFVALHRSARRDRGWALWAVLGALSMAAAFYLRSVAILMLPAVALVGWRRDRGRQHLRGLLPFAIFLGLVSPWLIYSRRELAADPAPSQQLLLRDYSTAMFHQDPGDPASPHVEAEEWMRRLQENGHDLLVDLSRTATPFESAGVGALVAALVLAGFVVSILRGPDLLDWLLMVYVALILTYFTYDSRLALPLAPLALMYVLELLGAIGRRAAQSRTRLETIVPGVGVGVLLLVQVVALPSALDAASRPGEVGGTMGETWVDIAKIGSWLRENTPADANILCNRAPILSVASQRRCVSYRFLRGADFIERYDLQWVVFDAYAPPRLRKFVRDRSADRTILESSVENGKIVIFRLER